MTLSHSGGQLLGGVRSEALKEDNFFENKRKTKISSWKQFVIPEEGF